MDNKKKKLIAIIITAIISTIIALTATALGIAPDEIATLLPDSGVADVDSGAWNV